MTQEYKDYLAHHGIEGQKWGKRRYQYEDGTLTPEGKKRYQKTDRQDTKDGNGSPKNGESTTRKGESSTWKSKDASTLSDEELNRRNSRLQRENQYRQLTQSRASRAAKWIGKTASAIFVATAITAMKANVGVKYKEVVARNAPKLVSKIFNKSAYLISKIASRG